MYRIANDKYRLIPGLTAMAVTLFASVALTRRGMVDWAGRLMLWTLLSFVVVMGVYNDGIHDSALFALPGLLFVAGLLFRRPHFYVFTFATLASVGTMGLLEVNGVLQNPYSRNSTTTDILDLFVIFGLTAMTVRLLSNNLLKSLSRAQTSEQEARAHAERLRQSELRYRLLFNSGNDAVMVHGFDALGLPGRFLEVNDIACERLGYMREELLKMCPLDIDDPETIPRVPEIMEKLRAEHYAVWEGVHRARDGRRIPVEISNHLFDFGGVPTVLATVRDITERKRADEQLKASLREKEVLLREVHHRVKNNMQVISSMLSLESSKITDAATRQHFQDSMNRIHSMALVHEKLYGSGNLATVDFGEYLTSVTTQLMRSYRREGVNCSVEAEQVSLGVDVAVPCGLIVNELVSNSLKHGFRDRDRGTVLVKLVRRDDRTVELVVQDDGVGFPEGVDFRNVPSMGLTLVSSLAEQIEGTVDLQREGGTRFVLRFPA
jgi:PAS domain S-box-containing protein